MNAWADLFQSALLALGALRALDLLLRLMFRSLRTAIARAKRDAFAAERGADISGVYNICGAALRRAAVSDRDAFIAAIQAASGGAFDTAQKAAILRIASRFPEVANLTVEATRPARAVRDLAMQPGTEDIHA